MALFDELKAKANYAQRDAFDGYGFDLLHEISGMSKMARELNAISSDEYLELNQMTVYFMNTFGRQCKERGIKPVW
ncbi:MAG: hypothetical protein IJQ81_15345 [Oscillibacter sp.]|nr:hypothetical protein [Oscillibacter sp.]